jgi:hypothetical protein
MRAFANGRKPASGADLAVTLTTRMSMRAVDARHFRDAFGDSQFAPGSRTIYTTLVPLEKAFVTFDTKLKNLAGPETRIQVLTS